MRKLLLTMWNDVNPKKLNNFFSGCLSALIFITLIMVLAFAFLGIAVGIAFLFSIPVDLAIIAIVSLAGLAAWAADAYERSK
jgi:preprotein translocase subunit SecF